MSRRLRRILDAQTFSKAQNKLERRFLAVARGAGLPKPRTQARLGRYRVDFHWPELGLVIETDSLTYHRTAAEQADDDYVREVLEDTIRHAPGPPG